VKSAALSFDRLSAQVSEERKVGIDVTTPSLQAANDVQRFEPCLPQNLEGAPGLVASAT